MVTPILATKLHLPRSRPGSVVRSRLLKQLEDGMYRKLTLISAPAGFGKTTLVSAWLAQSNRKSVWVSLDAEDSNLTRFLTYLVTGLQKLAPELGSDVLAALQAPQALSVTTLLTSLLNDVAAYPDNFLLILDDYHVIDSPTVDEALEFLIEHLPPQMHVVVTTREDPQLALPHLRAQDALTELRASHLRFTADEVNAFLNNGMHLNLSEDDIALLETRTEGWAAGLQMAALSLQGRDNSSEYIQAFTGSHRFILDYLAEEVLQRQPQHVQRFLLQTSILKRLCGALCEAVTGQAQSHELLEMLERNNLFVVPLDDRRQWYRYHHLFAEVLQAQLFKEHAEQLPELHLKASHWYEQQTLMPDAIHHALESGNARVAARLIELSWRAMDVSFQSATWLRWAQRLPENLIRISPVLSAGYGWALLNEGNFEASETKFRDAERFLQQPPPSDMLVFDEHEFKHLAVNITSARAYKAQALGDMNATIHHTRQALELLPEEDSLGRAIPNSLLGLALWTTGKLEAAFEALSAGLSGFESAGKVMAALSGVFGLADIRVAQGRLAEAKRVYERALVLATKDSQPVRGTGLLYLGLSELYFEQGELETAHHYLSLSETQRKHEIHKVFAHRWCLLMAKRNEYQHDFQAAATFLDEAASHQQELHVPVMHSVAAIQARLWIKAGALDKARDWRNAQGISAQDDVCYVKEFDHLTLVRLLIAEQQFEPAHALLTRLLVAAKTEKRLRSVIEILVLQALILDAQHNDNAALTLFKQALTLAEPEGFVQLITAEGDGIQRLLVAAETQGVLPEYVAKLRAFNALSPSAHPDASNTSAQMLDALIDPLTERELEVLQLIAQGFSNHAIAKQLFRALSTIKGHNRVIFAKLQVQNRTEAVARARELGLL